MAIMRTFRFPSASDELIGMETRVRAEELTTAAPVVVASTEDSIPRARSAFAGIVLVAAGAAVGWWIFDTTDPVPFKPASDYSALAGLFILAAAVERLLEPFASVVPDTAAAKKTLEAAVADSSMDPNSARKALAAANAQAALDRRRSERALILWGVATLVATLLCAVFGLLFLRAVSSTPGTDPNRFADLVVTGLVVGAGTKPLHDVVTRIQVAKDKATDPPETKA